MPLTNFQERAIFGTLYAGVVIVGILSGPAALLCIAMVVLFACWKEFTTIQQLSPIASGELPSLIYFSLEPVLPERNFYQPTPFIVLQQYCFCY